MTDLETRLREALQARAAEVAPDPATWQRVQQRLARRAWGARLALGGVAAAVVAVAAVALPSVLDRGEQADIAFPDPTGPTAQGYGAPDPDATALPAEPLVVGAGPTALLVTDGSDLAVTDLRGQAGTPVGEVDGTVTDLAVRPGSTPERLEYAYRSLVDDRCVVGRGVAGEPAGDVPPPLGEGASGCVPVISTDGTAVAWIVQDGGAATLHIAWWEPQATTATPAESVLPLPPLDAPLELVDWTQPLRDNTSTLIVRVGGGDEPGQLHQLTVQRTGDEWTLPHGQLIRLADEPGRVAVDHEGATTLEQDVASGGWLLAVDRQPVLDLPMLAGAGPGHVWMEAQGSTVVVGDGDDEAWVVELPADPGTATAPTPTPAAQPLPGRVVFATPFGAAATTTPATPPTAAAPPVDAPPTEAAGSPSPSSTATPSARPGPDSPSPEPTGSADDAGPTEAPADADAPAAVLDTAARIRAAAREASATGDWSALAALIPAQFSSNFGGETDHIAYYQRLQTDGEDVLGTLVALLAGPPTDNGQGYWVWPPAFAGDDPYYGWRVGIDGQGTWRYFVAGD